MRAANAAATAATAAAGSSSSSSSASSVESAAQCAAAAGMTPANIAELLDLQSIKTHSWHIQSCCAITGEGLYEVSRPASVHALQKRSQFNEANTRIDCFALLRCVAVVARASNG